MSNIYSLISVKGSFLLPSPIFSYNILVVRLVPVPLLPRRGFTREKSEGHPPLTDLLPIQGLRLE
jgi:hypothetical protein